MTKTPQWLPDGSGIDPLTIDPKTVVEVEWSNRSRLLRYVDEGGYQLTAEDVGNGSPYSWGDGRIVRVFADVTPPQPDPRVEVVARALHRVDPSNQDWAQLRVDASAILDALDTMGPDPEHWER